MPTPINDVLKDPEFQKFSPDEKRHALTELYPDFKGLGPDEQNQVVGYKAKDASPPGLLKKAVEFGKGAVKGAAQTVDNVDNMLTLGVDRKLQKMMPAGDGRTQYQARQDLFKPKNKAQEYGETAETVAETFVPIPGVSGIKAAKGAGLLAKGAVGAVRGAVDSGVRSLAKTGNPLDAAVGAAGGGVAGAVTGTLPKGISKLFASGARSQYAKALRPGGLAAKGVIGDRLLSGEADDLVGRGITGRSKDALLQRFSTIESNALKNLNNEYQRLGPNAKVMISGIGNDINAWVQKRAVTPVAGRVASPELVKAQKQILLRTMKVFGQGNLDPALEDVRRFRTVLRDEVIGRDFKANPETAKEKLGEVMREALTARTHSQHPTIEAFDRTYSFFRRAREVLEPVVTGDIGKETERGLGSQIKSAAGASGLALAAGGAGYAHGGQKDAIEWGTAAGLMSTAMRSTAWRTVSAVMKNRIADALVSGKGEWAAQLAARSVGLQVMRHFGPSAAKATGQPPGAGDSLTKEAVDFGKGAVRGAGKILSSRQPPVSRGTDQPPDSAFDKLLN